MGPDGERRLFATALGNVAKAQAAVQALSINFDAWMGDEIAKLDLARAEIDPREPNIEAVSALYMRAHDIKGLAPTFGYPVIQALSSTLCRLIDDDALAFEFRLPLIDDHIDAIRTLVAGKARTAADPLAQKLADQLADDVSALLDAAL